MVSPAKAAPVAAPIVAKKDWHEEGKGAFFFSLRATLVATAAALHSSRAAAPLPYSL